MHCDFGLAGGVLPVWISLQFFGNAEHDHCRYWLVDAAGFPGLLLDDDDLRDYRIFQRIAGG